MSSELATLLSGRYVEIEMLPLSFKEFVGALDEATLQRELAPFEKIKDNYPKYLLTLNEVFSNENYNGVIKLNILEWLLK